MTDAISPIEDRLTATDVVALRRIGLLPAERFLAATLMVRDTVLWDAWARRALLALGVGHVLAGIGFFFAYNWADLPPWGKFALVDMALVAAVAGTYVFGIDKPVGRVCLIGASVLSGVLLAVIGQVYQTGADAYDLFTAWTLLILPFLLAARDPAHTVLWLAVAYTAAATFATQVLEPEGLIHSSEVVAGLGWLLAIAMLIWDAAAKQIGSWRPHSWARRTLLAGAGLHALAAVCSLLLFRQGTGAAFAAGAFLLVLFPLLFSRLLIDHVAFVIATGFTGLAVMALGYAAIDRTIWQSGSGQPELLVGLALLVMWCAATAAAMTLLFRRISSHGRPA